MTRMFDSWMGCPRRSPRGRRFRSSPRSPEARYPRPDVPPGPSAERLDVRRGPICRTQVPLFRGRFFIRTTGTRERRNVAKIHIADDETDIRQLLSFLLTED